MTMNDEKHFTLEELSALTSLSRRTIRFYMQIGIVPRPEGANRGAYYLVSHLDRLLEIRKWQNAGISLNRIRELLDNSAGAADIPARRRSTGDISVKSHIFLRPGAELVIDPAEAGFTPEEVRELTQGIMRCFDQIKQNQNQPVIDNTPNGEQSDEERSEE
ncbi:MerR family transcriptional regulator [Succinimonas sp.]|uniref:MerR family transcriptional regulator n=1 Tax=Succinimonas sp. TaxID=1936151 RepID=UPI00386D03BE